MKLTTAQMTTLAALYELQPVTVKALNLYLGRNCREGNDALLQLVALKLVTRKKWTPPPTPELTEDQRLGFDPNVPKARLGKRPYLYELTPAAYWPAYHLAQALAALNRQEENA